MNTKTLYFIKHIVLVALFVVGLMLVPSAGSALAQKTFEKEVATTEMLSYALNLKSVSDVAVYSENTVDGKGDVTLTNGYRRAGGDEVNRKDLANAFSAINQLPCTEVADSDLSGKTFTPGVYCLASVDLSGRLVMDGQGNANAIFVFKIANALNAKVGTSVGVENGAQAGNVFFTSNDTAHLESGVDFKGSIFSRNDIVIGENTTVDGRVLSVKGGISVGSNVILGPQQTGVLEICKELDVTLGNGLENRLFRFAVAGLIVEVAGGQCSGPLVVPSGPQTITELQTGRTLSGGTFNGNFQLSNVRQLKPDTSQTTALTSANLPNFTANVVVQEGGIANQIRIQFTNRFAITANVEICKEGLDSGVIGFFNFTINELRAGDQTASGGVVTTPAGALTPFTVPVGQCSGPIAFVVPSDVSSGTPLNGLVTINELPRKGFIFTNASTAIGTVAPISRLVNFNVLANGGGNATVLVVASSAGAAAQTVVFFNNRTAPAALKICKIAGPGITVGSSFSFTVTGTNPLDPVSSSTTFTGGGTAATGATLRGGIIRSASVNVIAGSVEDGGGCNDVPGLFVVDTAATVTELDATANFGEVRVSRITSSSGIIAAGGPEAGTTSRAATAPTTISPLFRQPGVPFFPTLGNTDAERTVTVPVTREVAEVEYVNIAFAPVPLKICKVAGSASLLNQPFTFTVTPDTAGGLLAPFSRQVVILAGPTFDPNNPRRQVGFCDFVSGPFAGAQINGLNSFNFGSQVSIQETGFGSTVINAGGITSPTGYVAANRGTRTAIVPNLVNGVNEVQFVNTAGTSCSPSLNNTDQPTCTRTKKRIRFL